MQQGAALAYQIHASIQSRQFTSQCQQCISHVYHVVVAMKDKLIATSTHFQSRKSFYFYKTLCSVVAPAKLSNEWISYKLNFLDHKSSSCSTLHFFFQHTDDNKLYLTYGIIFWLYKNLNIIHAVETVPLFTLIYARTVCLYFVCKKETQGEIRDK